MGIRSSVSLSEKVGLSIGLIRDVRIGVMNFKIIHHTPIKIDIIKVWKK